MMTDVLIGTAGHIDHGKTTLVRALTGINTDRLKEEQARGITIDIGFAHCELDGFRVGFIDVPGHERFVKNMLAGVGGIQSVLLVVAADESVMPQTREHFEICRLLGIRCGLVVLSKKNAVEAELLPLVREEVRELLAGSVLEDAPIVAVDSVSGEGLDELRAALQAHLEEMQREGLLEQASQQIFRMPIDRVFTIRGFGTVVTGTPGGGTLARDAPVSAYPGALKSKVRGIEIFGQPAAEARGGQRTALNLTGLEREQLTRGMVLSAEDGLRPSHMFDVRVQLIEQTPALPHRAPVRFHHGSAETVGRLYLLDTARMEPGGRALAQLRLDQPVLAFPGERFILRRYSPMTTIGGGLILDNAPPKHRHRDLQETLADLGALADGFDAGIPWTALLARLVARRGSRGITLSELVAATGLRPDALSEVIAASRALTRSEQDSNLVFHGAAVEEARSAILDFLEEFHDANPLASGASQEEVKKRLLRHAPAAFFQSLLRALEREGAVRLRAGVLALAERRPRLSDGEEALRQSILQRMTEQSLTPPTLEDLERSLEAPPGDVRKIFFYLIEQGELVRITENYVLLPDQLTSLAQQVGKRFPNRTPFSVGEFKEIFALSRKYAIPLLEHLDRQRITQRLGDQRVVL